MCKSCGFETSKSKQEWSGSAICKGCKSLSYEDFEEIVHSFGGELVTTSSEFNKQKQGLSLKLRSSMEISANLAVIWRCSEGHESSSMTYLTIRDSEGDCDICSRETRELYHRKFDKCLEATFGRSFDHMKLLYGVHI